MFEIYQSVFEIGFWNLLHIEEVSAAIQIYKIYTLSLNV